MINYDKLCKNYTTNVILVRFMQKYNPPDASNLENYIQIIFLCCHVKIISEMQKCI